MKIMSLMEDRLALLTATTTSILEATAPMIKAAAGGLDTVRRATLTMMLQLSGLMALRFGTYKQVACW